MDDKGREELFRRMAARYAEAEGEELRKELKALEQEGEPYPTHRMDWRVRGAIQARKRARMVRTAALLAACFVLVLLLPRALDRAPGLPGAASQAEDATPPEAASEAGEGGIIPLSFTLPAHFAQTGVEQDNAQSIYYLQHALLDDVVMTLEYAEGPFERAALTEIDINGRAAYGSATADYSLLTFEKEGIRYVLTCRYDINTLVGLGKNIL